MKYTINEHLAVELDKYGKVNILVDGEHFNQCSYILMTVPRQEAYKTTADSIDELKDRYSNENERNDDVIDNKTQFWAHCSNLQAWYEHDYDTRLLHSNLSFPLLKKLTELGDKTAQEKFADEIKRRVKSGYPSTVEYLLQEGYLHELDKKYVREIIPLIYKNIAPMVKLLYQKGMIVELCFIIHGYSLRAVHAWRKSGNKKLKGSFRKAHRTTWKAIKMQLKEFNNEHNETS